MRPIVGARFPLERAGEALELIDGRGALGKVVLGGRLGASAEPAAATSTALGRGSGCAAQRHRAEHLAWPKSTLWLSATTTSHGGTPDRRGRRFGAYRTPNVKTAARRALV